MKMKIFHKLRNLGILVFCICCVVLSVGCGKNATASFSKEEQSKTYLSGILEPQENEYHWSAVVMDAKTGEILDSYGNMEQSYEPSTPFKIIPTAILLEKGNLELTDVFSGSSYYDDNITIRSHNNQNEEKTFLEHFININEPLMIRAWNNKGSHLDFQKEVTSFITPKKYLDKSDSTSYYLLGKGFEVTVLDMANAYLELANNHENDEMSALSEENSKKIRELLHDAYLNYPYMEPELMDIQTIGEIGGLYGSTYYIEDEISKVTSSFAGFAPYDDPQIIFAISLEKTGEIDSIGNNNNILATISTEVFQHYLPKRYFQEIVDMSQFESLNDDIEHFIYVGRPTCGPCKRIEPLVRNRANVLEKTVFYLNTDRFRDNDEMQSFFEINKVDDVPCMLKVKNDQLLDMKLFTGELDLENYIDSILSQ